MFGLYSNAKHIEHTLKRLASQYHKQAFAVASKQALMRGHGTRGSTHVHALRHVIERHPQA